MIRKALSILLTLCFAIMPYLPAEATFGWGQKPISVLHDFTSGTKATVLWFSTAELHGGVCHKEVITEGQQASYTYTKEQRKGELSIGVIVEYTDPSEPWLTGQVKVGGNILLSGKKRTIPLQTLLFFSEGYVEKEVVFSKLYDDDFLEFYKYLALKTTRV